MYRVCEGVKSQLHNCISEVHEDAQVNNGIKKINVWRVVGCRSLGERGSILEVLGLGEPSWKWS